MHHQLLCHAGMVLHHQLLCHAGMVLHGMMSSMKVCWLAMLRHAHVHVNMQYVWPNFKIYSLAATTVFNIPFWRHFVAWIGSVPATRANFKRLLSKGSVAVIVGGIAGGPLS